MPARTDLDVNRVVGARLRVARVRAGMTREQLALRVGVEPVSIYRFETGARGVSLAMLFALGEALGARPAEILDIETPAHLIPSQVLDAAATDLLAAFHRLPVERQVLAVRLVRALHDP